MQWQLLLHLVDRLPERLPTRVPHRLHVPRARQFEVFELHVGDAMDLLHRAIDAALGQAGEADLAVRIVAAEILQPIVVDARLILRTGMFDDTFPTIADVQRFELGSYPDEWTNRTTTSNATCNGLRFLGRI